jgi:hypothetical protein
LAVLLFVFFYYSIVEEVSWLALPKMELSSLANEIEDPLIWKLAFCPTMPYLGAGTERSAELSL